MFFDINEVRKKLKDTRLTQAEMANHLDIHKSTVNRWFQGRTPVPQKYWNDIAAFLNTPIGQLIMIEEGNNGEEGSMAEAENGEAKKHLTSADRLLAAQEVMKVLEKYGAKEYCTLMLIAQLVFPGKQVEISVGSYVRL
jgi:transcriptional regulator with XRE-family HTH domain